MIKNKDIEPEKDSIMDLLNRYFIIEIKEPIDVIDSEGAVQTLIPQAITREHFGIKTDTGGNWIPRTFPFALDLSKVKLTPSLLQINYETPDGLDCYVQMMLEWDSENHRYEVDIVHIKGTSPTFVKNIIIPQGSKIII